MKAHSSKLNRHAAYAQRKRDKAAARRREYVKERNMLAYGQKRSGVVELRTPEPVQRWRAMGRAA